MSSREVFVWYFLATVLSTLNAELPERIRSSNGLSVHSYYERPNVGQRTITKVILTQKGYLQFLRYEIDVPPIVEFTFCIWLQSNNFTYPHPLLSYSINEKNRLIRAWITPHGRSIRLAIKEIPVFHINVNFQEHKWYHLCMSWDSILAKGVMFINGKTAMVTTNPDLRGTVIPDKGDIVVGQEYTDFDKGLNDGIEGNIFGFNMVLESAFGRQRSLYLHQPFYNTKPWYQPIRPIYNEFYKRPELMYQFVLNDHNSNSFRRRIQRRVTSGPPFHGFNSIPLGMQLVDLGYKCMGKGSPLKNDKVLVSWTRTPVRVFGGAVYKTIPSFC